MSHFSKITTEIKDEEALRKASKRMGLELIQNGNCRYYYGTSKVDMLLKLPGEYDLGLMKEGDHFNIKADFYGGHVEKYVGVNAGLFTQSYAVEKAKMEAFKQSLAVTEKKEGRDIILTLMEPETGGQVIVTCHEGGKIDVKTQGFSGESCMKFKELEESLGALESRKATMEMYQTEPINSVEYIKTLE